MPDEKEQPGIATSRKIEIGTGLGVNKDIEIEKIRATYDISVACLGCLWRMDSMSERSACAHAARHSRRTGHETIVQWDTIVNYSPETEDSDR